MLKAEDEPQKVVIGGSQSPPPPTYEDKNRTEKTHKRLQFNMATKIQIIPNNRQGQLNTAYLKTLPGMLKMIEIAVAFVTYVLAICADRRATTSAWTEHIAFECLIIISLFLMGYVIFPHITIKDEPTREGLIVVELIFYAVNTFMFFIAVWLMVHLSARWGTDGRGAAILAAILCVALTVIFAIETFHKIKAWRSEVGSTQVINNATTAGRRYETNAELSRNPGAELP